jgi:pimeloyl-ACP methyl ester carboxylesterase
VLRSFAGGRLFGSLTGEAPPRVLALHGWARTHRDFDAVLAPATPTGPPLPAIALDLPGFGATPAPPGPWGSAQYAEAVAPVLDEMDQPVVVLGHSFGGRVGLHLAASYPRQVRALVLTGVPLAPPPGRRARPAAGYRLVRGLRRVHLVSEDRLEAARQRYGSPDYRAAQGVMRQVFVKVVGERYEEQLAAIDCPVSLVWGDDDTAAPLAVPDALRQAVTRSLA